MAGASEGTQRVSFVNANWTAANDDRPGFFALSIVTEDGERHSLPVPDGQLAGLVALTQASSVMLFDPEDRTLIAANLVGEWIQQDWSAGDRRDSAG